MPDKFGKTKKNRKYVLVQKGFSLIEVLFTMLVLSIGITSVAALMTANIKNYANSRDQIIASMLAQEGIELARNLKDNGDLNDDNPNVCHFSRTDECESLIVDAISSQIERSPDKNELRLYRNVDADGNGNGLFAHLFPSSEAETRFFRKLSFDIDGSVEDSDRIMTVTSFVTWNNKGFVENIADVENNPDSCNTANECVSVVSVMLYLE